MPPAIGPKHKVKLNGKDYYLALKGSEPVYGTGTRALQDVPSDHWRLVYDDFSRGVGADFYAGDDFLTTVKGKLYPRPAVTTISVPTTIITNDIIVDWFTSGNYLYAVGYLALYKFDINVNPPVLKRVCGIISGGTAAVSPFNTSDRLGQTALMYSARATAGYRRYIPLNNGARFMALDTVGDESSIAFSPTMTLNGAINASTTSVVYTSAGDAASIGDVIIIDSERMFVTLENTGTNTLTVVRGWAGTTAATHADTTAITQATPDTFTAVTAVTTGASHFQQMPDAKVWRAIASLSSIAASNVAKVSALDAGDDCEVEANWGQAFPVDDQTVPIISLMNYDELLIVGKQNGWFAATQNADGSVFWRNLLPDAYFSSVAITEQGQDKWGRGAVWHAKMWLTSPDHLYRDTLLSALPLGPDANPNNTGDEAAVGAATLRFGNISRLAGMGAWLYAPYNRTGGTVEVLVGREAEPGDQFETPWGLAFKATGNTTTYGSSAYIQKLKTGAPRLWIYSIHGTTGGAFDWISLSQDGGPYSTALTYGNASVTARLYLMPHLFPCTVLLREFRYVIESGDAEATWGLEMARDGGSAAAVGSAVTATGSVFWTAGTNDTARRVQPIIVGTFSSGYTPTATPPRVLECSLEGYYLPDVGDTASMVIDLRKTATERKVSVTAVRAELLALRSNAYNFVDPWQTTTTAQRLLVRDASGSAAAKVAGEMGSAFMAVNGEIVEYT